jgi:hypothetical protein
VIEHSIVAEDDNSTDRARRIRLGLVISIVFNLIGLAVFWHVLGLRHEPPDRRSPVEVISITRKPPAVPVVEPPKVVQRPIPVQQKQHPVAAAAAAPPATAPKVTPPLPPPRVVPHPAELAKHGGGAHARAVPKQPVAGVTNSTRTKFSAAKIAAITQELQGEIDADRGAHGLLAVKPEPAPTMKRFAMDLGDLTAGSLSHHGLCDPIKDWQDGGWDYYYVACNVRFSDGTFQRQDVPWPVRFPPNDDPFTGTSRQDKPLAMPLPGWHLQPGESVSVELREYAHDHGVDI